MVDNSALHADRLTASVACRSLPENLIRSESVREVADAARLVLASTPTAALPGLAGLDMVAWLVLPSPVRHHRPSPAAPQTTHPRRLPTLSPPGVPDRIDPIIPAGDPLVCAQKPPRRPQTRSPTAGPTSVLAFPRLALRGLDWNRSFLLEADLLDWTMRKPQGKSWSVIVMS